MNLFSEPWRAKRPRVMIFQVGNPDGTTAEVEVQVKGIGIDLDFVSDGPVSKEAREAIAHRLAQAFAVAFPGEPFPVNFSMLLNGGMPTECGLAH